MEPAAKSGVETSVPQVSSNLVHGISARVGHFRWVICALLLFGVTKNYMDRQVLGVLKTVEGYSMGDLNAMNLTTHLLDEAIRFGYGEVPSLQSLRLKPD